MRLSRRTKGNGNFCQHEMIFVNRGLAVTMFGRLLRLIKDRFRKATFLPFSPVILKIRRHPFPFCTGRIECMTSITACPAKMIEVHKGVRRKLVEPRVGSGMN